MPLALRHSHEPSFAGETLSGLTIEREMDTALIAAVQGVSRQEIERRFTADHRAYLAWWEGWPAAWGWVATRSAEIGELGSSFQLPKGERYLWNFVTLPRHRGKGIYPRLLDSIVAHERSEAENFWIAYAPENHASAAGIRKAGFTVVAELSFDGEGHPAVRSLDEARGAAAARLLGLPIVGDPLAPCWHCVRQNPRSGAACRAGECTCDYQKLRAGRAA